MQGQKVRASLKHHRQSPRKVRELADLVRGVMVDEADIALQGVNRKGSQELRGLIKSAVANAENNFKLDKHDLHISEIRVDEAPVMKRFRARAFGRAAQILKRACHVNIVLEPMSAEKKEVLEDQKTPDSKEKAEDEKKDGEKNAKESQDGKKPVKKNSSEMDAAGGKGGGKKDSNPKEEDK